MNFRETKNADELDLLISELVKIYDDKYNEIVNTSRDKRQLFENLTGSAAHLRRDLETAINLYNPNINDLLEVYSARLSQQKKMLSTYLDYSSRIVPEVDKWVSKI